MAIRERSSIEVFFSALGDEKVQASFLRIAAAAKIMQRGIRSANSNIIGGFGDINRGFDQFGSTVLRAGGLLTAFGRRGYNIFSGIISSGLNAARSIARIGVVAAGVSVGGLFALGAAIANIQDANQGLVRVALGLRAINNEVKNSNGTVKQLPKFSFSNGTLTDTTGGGFDQQGEAADFAYVQKAADSYGVSIVDLSKSYVAFRAANKATTLTLEEQREVYEGVIEAGVTLGLTNESIQGTLQALQQMSSKGFVSLEELRQQLGDRLPGAIATAARAFGVTTKELLKMIDKGLDADTFLRKFGKQLKTEYAESAKAAMNTTAAAVQRFSNAWTLAKVVTASGPLDEAIKRVAVAARDLIYRLGNNETFQRFGISLAAIVDRITGYLGKGDAFFHNLLYNIVRLANGALDYLEYLGRGIATLYKAFQDDVWTDSPFLNVLLTLKHVITEAFKALTQSGPLATMNSLGQGLQRLAGFFFQLSLAIANVRMGFGTKQMLAGMDVRFQFLTDWVAGLGETFRKGDGFVAGFFDALINGYDKAAGNKFGAFRDAMRTLGDLFDNKAYQKGDRFEALFKLRDAAIKVGDAFLAALPHVVRVIDKIYTIGTAVSPIGNFIAQLLGFGNVLELLFTYKILNALGALSLIKGLLRILVIAPLTALMSFVASQFALTGLTTAVLTALGELVAGIGIFQAVLLGGLVVLAIAAAVGLGVFIYAYRKELKQAFSDIGTYITETFATDVGNSIKYLGVLAGQAGIAIKDGFIDILNGSLNFLIEQFRSIFEFMQKLGAFKGIEFPQFGKSQEDLRRERAEDDRDKTTARRIATERNAKFGDNDQYRLEKFYAEELKKVQATREKLRDGQKDLERASAYVERIDRGAKMAKDEADQETLDRVNARKNLLKGLDPNFAKELAKQNADLARDPTGATLLNLMAEQNRKSADQARRDPTLIAMAIDNKARERESQRVAQEKQTALGDIDTLALARQLAAQNGGGADLDKMFGPNSKAALDQAAKNAAQAAKMKAIDDVDVLAARRRAEQPEYLPSELLAKMFGGNREGIISEKAARQQQQIEQVRQQALAAEETRQQRELLAQMFGPGSDAYVAGEAQRAREQEYARSILGQQAVGVDQAYRTDAGTVPGGQGGFTNPTLIQIGVDGTQIQAMTRPSDMPSLEEQARRENARNAGQVSEWGYRGQ